MPAVTYSCVLAEQPKFALQCRTWAWSLLELAGVDPANLVVHYLPGSCSSTRHWLERNGIGLLAIEPFDPRNPYCNKIRQLESQVFHASDYCVLCDTDIAFCAPIEDLFHGMQVRAKLVDKPNPSVEVWKAIIAAAQVPAPEYANPSCSTETTPSVNCNGGLYVIPRNHIASLATAWSRWALWLLDRKDVLLAGNALTHTDQIAFGLALLENEIPLEPLSMTDNFPTHLPVSDLPDVSPRIIHYHSNVNASHSLEQIGLPRVDCQIQRVNDVIRRRLRADFDNRSFWNFRYQACPELGSGHGSRGGPLTEKARILGKIADDFAPGTILDIGCGDLEISRDLPVKNYLGVDVSSAAIEIARAKRPDWSFTEGDPRQMRLEATELVVCLDVLIHQPSMAEYQAFVTRLLELAQRFLLVSGYNQPPWYRSEITFFYEPLTASLQRVAPAATLELVGGYRDTSVVLVKR